MKYLWIIMLAVIDIIWIIASIREFIRALIVISKWGFSSFFEFIDDFITEVEDWAHGCVWIHVLFVFFYSLILYISSSGVAE